MAAHWDQVVEAFRRYVLSPVGLTVGDVQWFLIRVPRFILVVVFFYLLGKAIIWILNRTFLASEPEDPMIQSLVESLVFAVMVMMGVGFGLLIYDVNILNLAVTVGLIGAGMALGLRNSVANVMGGIALATDRPFEVGDRIQIGEFWGDVVDIGLRSTRVLTARREYVVVPNSLMDEREIWNYTKEYSELRLEVAATISYDSDPERASRIMEKVARDSDLILDYPEPQVLVRELGESGIELELWCYTGNARRRYYVSSRLRREVLEAFHENGVEIPYPYRTLVEKTDLPEPEQGIPEGYGRDDLGDRRILVASSGHMPARRKADTIAELAQELEADVVLAYITSRASILTEREGERAAEVLQSAAQPKGVKVKLVTEEGQVSPSIQRLVEEEGCGAAVIGASPPPTVMAWKRAQVEDRLRMSLDVPVITIPGSLHLDPEEIEAVRDSLDEIAGPPDEGAEAEDSGGERR